MAKKGKAIRVSDESINSYGYWVKTDGIDTTDFLKNPIMLWNHNRAWRGTQDEVLPIGFWEDLKFEDGSLTGTPVFSDTYDFAKKIADMYEEGVLVASSIGIQAIEWSDDESLIKQGQRYSTVTKCKLVEISICDIPSNKNAVVLYDTEGGVLNLSDNAESVLPVITHKKKSEMKELLNHLKLAENTNEADVIKFVGSLEAKILRLESEKVAQLKAEVKTLLDAAEVDNRITATMRPHFEKLFDLDFESAKDALASLEVKPKINLADFANNSNDNKPKFNGKTWTELYETDNASFLKLKSENFELFKLMYKSDMGTDWKE